MSRRYFLQFVGGILVAYSGVVPAAFGSCGLGVGCDTAMPDLQAWALIALGVALFGFGVFVWVRAAWKEMRGDD